MYNVIMLLRIFSPEGDVHASIKRQLYVAAHGETTLGFESFLFIVSPEWS